MRLKNISFLNYWGFPVIATLLCSSCKKFVNVDPPTNKINSTAVFTSDATATSAVLGIYSGIMISNGSILNGGLSLYSGLSADELTHNSPDPNIDAFSQNSILPTNSIILQNFWQRAYTSLYQINACIDGLSSPSASMTASLNTQLLGESKFMRALYDFYLVNAFGDVPLVTTTNYTTNQSLPRTPVAQVYQQIFADLYDAQRLLTDIDPAQGPIRPNKWSATALLARVHLYQKNWQRADSAASAVINSGKYTLLNNLNSIFLANSKEAIFQLEPNNPGFNTAEGNFFIPQRVTLQPDYKITPFLVNAFETNDLRKSAWLTTIVNSGITYIVPYKYKLGYNFSSTTPTEYNMVLRYAELFLIRAEAEVGENSLPGAQADLNIIRNRAGLPNTTASGQTALLGAIQHDRQIEFFAEFGHRWFDLIRWGQGAQILTANKGFTVSTNSLLYPIPFSQLQLNPFLTQNAGY